MRRKTANLFYPEGEQIRNELRRELEIDSLTGVGNRKAFFRAKDRANCDPDSLIIFFDLNNFGQVNKLCGHSEGDNALKCFADYLRKRCRDFNLPERIFRYGGDEFVMIVPAQYRESYSFWFSGFELLYEKLDGKILRVYASPGIGEDFYEAEFSSRRKKEFEKRYFGNSIK